MHRRRERRPTARNPKSRAAVANAINTIRTTIATGADAEPQAGSNGTERRDAHDKVRDSADRRPRDSVHRPRLGAGGWRRFGWVRWRRCGRFCRRKRRCSIGRWEPGQRSHVRQHSHVRHRQLLEPCRCCARYDDPRNERRRHRPVGRREWPKRIDHGGTTWQSGGRHQQWTHRRNNHAGSLAAGRRSDPIRECAKLQRRSYGQEHLQGLLMALTENQGAGLSGVQSRSVLSCGSGSGAHGSIFS